MKRSLNSFIAMTLVTMLVACVTTSGIKDYECKTIAFNELNINPDFDTSGYFTIVVLPDTQYYTKIQPYKKMEVFKRQAEWIAGNQENLNIKAVIHVGDVTQKNKSDQWAIAEKAFKVLDGIDIPYSIIPGNHDYKDHNEKCKGKSSFNCHFGPDKFKNKGWYKKGMNYNSCITVNAGGKKFLIIGIEYKPTVCIENDNENPCDGKNMISPKLKPLAWAKEIIVENPGTPIIISTHSYIDKNGVHRDDAEKIKSELIDKFENVFLILSGHKGGSYYKKIERGCKPSAHAILTNYQWESPKGKRNPYKKRGGNGWLRTLTFLPKENKIIVRVFSTEEGKPAIFGKDGIAKFYNDKFNPVGPPAEAPAIKEDEHRHHNFDIDLKNIF